MKVLLTGANGYIGARLLPLLAEEGHEIYALVRNRSRIEILEKFRSQIHVIEADLLVPSSLEKIPTEIDAAYYLVHSMNDSQKFSELEAYSAKNFTNRMEKTNAKQIIYLSGLSNEPKLSSHLSSRKRVGEILRGGKIPVTILMAGIIIGSGSASFEIIRDLVEKLPFMIAPKWLHQLTQPIAVRDVLSYLTLVLDNPSCLDQSFEIGGPNVMSYKTLLLKFAKMRGLKRKIITVPVLTPRLSSYWLVFVTSTSFSLARFLVDSLINNAVCKENRIQDLFKINLLTYEDALALSFSPIDEDWMPSGWKDTLSRSTLNPDLSMYIQVPKFGTLTNHRIIRFTCNADEVLKRIWTLRIDQGLREMNRAWPMRNSADFWRVLLADEKNRRLILYAEKKLPGDAWLEFKIIPNEAGGTLHQIVSFRPKGLGGRLYWYALYPFHYYIFWRLAKGMVKNLWSSNGSR